MSDWQPIATAPKGADLLFWIVPKTAEETYVDSSGRPIVGGFAPYLHFGPFGSWSSLSKATHWHLLPATPEA